MMRPWKIAAIVLGVVGFFALASYVMTSRFWDGGFPSGEFRIDLHDSDGRPIQGGVLRVYHGGTRDLAFNYPLDNHVPGHELVSDERGRITAIRKDGGLQFGGHAWELFWVIPLGAKAPQYDCEITAEGFKPLKFRIWRLFDSPYKSYEDFPKTNLTVQGTDLELPVYEHAFTLER